MVSYVVGQVRGIHAAANFNRSLVCSWEQALLGED
jgi:hypothetical protein